MAHGCHLLSSLVLNVRSLPVSSLRKGWPFVENTISWGDYNSYVISSLYNYLAIFWRCSVLSNKRSLGKLKISSVKALSMFRGFKQGACAFWHCLIKLRRYYKVES